MRADFDTNKMPQMTVFDNQLSLHNTISSHILDLEPADQLFALVWPSCQMGKIRDLCLYFSLFFSQNHYKRQYPVNASLEWVDTVIVPQRNIFLPAAIRIYGSFISVNSGVPFWLCMRQRYNNTILSQMHKKVCVLNQRRWKRGLWGHPLQGDKLGNYFYIMQLVDNWDELQRPPASLSY